MNNDADSMDTEARGDGAGCPPSLAAQTPGVDLEQAAHTLRDAEAYDAASDPWGSRHVLVPLDGSRLAAAALPYAVALARAADARISLLSVVEFPPAPVRPPRAAGREGDERHVAENTAHLESVAAPCARPASR